MYKVIAKQQRPNYKWEKTTVGPFIMKDEADAAHDRQARIARELLGRREIIDYQIETIETT